MGQRPPERISKYDAFKAGLHGVHGSCDQPGGRGLCPVCVAGHRAWGGSDGTVQVQLFREALIPGVPRPPAGRAARTRRPPPVHARRPVRGSVRAERASAGAARRQASAPPAAEEPDRVIPVAGPAGPSLPSPGRVNHVRVEPGEIPAFRLTPEVSPPAHAELSALPS